MTRSRCSLPRQGFTLIELVVAMALVLILAGFALPRWNTARFQADAAANMVRSTLQRAQRLAVQRQHDQVVSFDTAGRRVRLLDDANNDLQVSAGERVTWTALPDGGFFVIPATTLGGASATAPIEGFGIDVADGFPSILFRRNGSSSAGIEVFVAAGAGEPTSQRALLLTRATGRVELWRHSTTGWVKEGP
jgi:prepilin-type N-terminal cleavage/methylation domain-containing protein